MLRNKISSYKINALKRQYSTHILFTNKLKARYLNQQLENFSRIAVDDYPRAIQKLIDLVEKARYSKDEINRAHNDLCATNKVYKRNIELAIENHLKLTTPHITKISLSPDKKAIPIFRSVSSEWAELHDIHHWHGVAAPLVNIRSGSRKAYAPEIATYYVNAKNKTVDFSKKNKEKVRFDMVGFVFGPLLSTSPNAAHVIGERFTTPDKREKQDRVILLMAATEGYCATQAIFNGSGYVRNKENGFEGQEGTGCQEHSREVVPGPHVDHSQVIGYRMAYKDGRMSQFVSNTSIDPTILEEMQKYVDVQLFLNANNVQEALEYELLMSDDPIHKVESFETTARKLNEKDNDLKKTIQMEAKYRHYPDALTPIHEQEKQLNYDTAYLKTHGFVVSLKKQIALQELRNSNDYLDTLKAPSKEALQKRALDAYLKQKEEFTSVKEVAFDVLLNKL